jgi:hypothetical protein
MSERAAAAMPTPMPIFTPEARPLLEVFGEEGPLVLDVAAPVLVTPVGVPLPREGALEIVCVGVALPEGGAGPALVIPLPPVGEFESLVGLGSGEAGLVESPEGVWPAWNAMLCPVLWGNDANCARLSASLKAMVVLAALVQLQKDPGWSVVGSLFCEHGAHLPSLLSQSVSAIHGWSAAGQRRL